MSYLKLPVFTIKQIPDFIDPDMLSMIKDDKSECMSMHGTTEEMIDKAGSGDISKDKSITCYMHCLLSRLGMLDENGYIDRDMMLGVIPDSIQAKAESVLNTCGNLEGADPCEQMYNAAVCVYTNCPEMWFMV